MWCQSFWNEQSKLAFVDRDHAADFVMDALQDPCFPWDRPYQEIVEHLETTGACYLAIECFKRAWQMSGRELEESEEEEEEEEEWDEEDEDEDEENSE